MIKSILSIGLNDKDTKKQEISTKQALEIVSKICFEKTDGATLIPDCIGVYKHDNGEKVLENSIRAEFYGEKPENILTVAKILCKLLNQESIAYEQTEIKSEFISA